MTVPAQAAAKLATRHLMLRVVALQSGKDVPPEPPLLVKRGSVTAGIDWFLRKQVVSPDEYGTLDRAERAKAFAIANVTQLDVAAAAKESLAKAIAEGQTKAEWQRSLSAELRKAFVGTASNPGDRLDTAFRTTTHSALNAGIWDEAMQPDALETRPYFRSVVIPDARICPICEPLRGVVLKADDPRLAAWWTPRHHRCRCSWRPVTPAQAEQSGITPQNFEYTGQIPKGFGGAPGSLPDLLDGKDPSLAAIAREKERQFQAQETGREAAHVEPPTPGSSGSAPPTPPPTPPSGGDDGGGDDGDRKPWPPPGKRPGGSLDVSQREPLPNERPAVELLVEQGARIVMLEEGRIHGARSADAMMHWPPEGPGVKIEIKAPGKTTGVTTAEICRLVTDAARPGAVVSAPQAENVLVDARGTDLSYEQETFAFVRLAGMSHIRGRIRHLRIIRNGDIIRDEVMPR